jgi:hypothetical protein
MQSYLRYPEREPDGEVHFRVGRSAGKVGVMVKKMTGSNAGRAVLLLLVAGAGVVLWQYQRTKHVREELFMAFAPVALANCTLERFGDVNDGGYPMCGNLLDQARAAYSYGINGTDEWGCRMSARLDAVVQQYDCYNTTLPACSGGKTQFNAECVGPEPATIDRRPFDSMLRQVARNGDAGKRLIVKMDVEGSEWASLRDAPDSLLNDVDQLVVEFHGVEDPESIETVRRLKQLFHVVYVHQNNFACEPGLDPFPGSVFEVLFVNKRIAQLDSGSPGGDPSLDAPNAPWLPDCQELKAADQSSEFALFRRWVRRVARTQLASVGL